MSSLYFKNLSVFLDIYERVAASIGSEKQKDVAAALGITAAHINNLLAVAKGKEISKGPKTLPYKQLVNWAASNGISLDWLLTGEEPSGAGAETSSSPPQDHIHLPAWDNKPLSERERIVLQETLEVIRSAELGSFATALEQNVKSFRDSIELAGRKRQTGSSLQNREGAPGAGDEPSPAGKRAAGGAK